MHTGVLLPIPMCHQLALQTLKVVISFFGVATFRSFT
jgi:hypothetical protein